MNEEKLISIIVAVYNIEQYLPRCIESLIAQTYRNIEIILVDDGAKDNSAAICDDYASKDKRIKVVHKKNGGLSDARNAGLEVAEGDYIGFVDGDDWIENDMYRGMYLACEKENAQVAVCRYKQVSALGEEFPLSTGCAGSIDVAAADSVLLTREEALEIYVCGDERYIIYNSVWSKLFSREVIGDMRFPVGKNSEDIMFTTRAFVKMNRCVYVDKAYYNYVLDREGSIMNERAGERRIHDEIPFWREQITYFKEEGLEELSKKASYHFYRRMLFYYIDFMENKQTRVFAEEIIRQLKSEKNRIKAIYEADYIKTGDKVRMSFVLVMPYLYYATVKLYDKFIIPLRNKVSGKK